MALWKLFIFSGALRIVLIAYGSWHDSNFKVKYTDIDYFVFSDAAQHIVNGSSPYNRATYRYTPLLGFLMTPNALLHPCFGKVFFSLCDLIVAWLILLIKRQDISMNFLNEDGIRVSRPSKAMVLEDYHVAASLWLLNPFSLTISTRGNAESFQAILVLLTIWLMTKRKPALGGVCFGLAIHFKIYPVIYTLPMTLYIIGNSTAKCSKSLTFRQVLDMSVCILKNLFPFFFGAGIVLLGITALFFSWYKMEFIENTYLYHFRRTDIKHNFSPYFYVLYLTSKTSWSPFIGILAFLPQAVSVILVGIKYHRSLSVACFFQTFAFVTFNKVCTSQYFIWYLSLFPIAAGYMKLNIYYNVPLMLFLWLSAQGIWLFFAYLLEFQGFNAFFLVWLASIWFFVVNIYLLVRLMSSISLSDAIKRARNSKED